MGLVSSIARGVGEVAGFESSKTYDLQVIVKARNPKEAQARAKEILKAQGLHRGNFGPGGHRRMFTQYVAWGFASEVDGRSGWVLTHRKSSKQWQKNLAGTGHPTNMPMPFDFVDAPDLVDAGIDESNILDGTAWLVNAWLGRQFPHVGPISL